MPQHPAEFAFCLLVGSATALCHKQHACLAGEKPCEPARDVTRRLGSNGRGQGWEPFAHWRWLVVEGPSLTLGTTLTPAGATTRVELSFLSLGVTL